jgi:hypothetical protein
MPDLGKIDERIVSAEFEVRLARDMLFNNPPGQNFKTYSIYTKADKVKYNGKIQQYLYDMERKENHYTSSMGRAVAIKLDGLTRFVWRSDLLSKDEYDAVKREHNEKLRDLGKK